MYNRKIHIRNVSVRARKSDSDKGLPVPNETEGLIKSIDYLNQTSTDAPSNPAKNSPANKTKPRRQNMSSALTAEFAKHTLELHNRVPSRFIHYLNGSRNFSRKYIAPKTYQLPVEMGLDNNTVIYMAEQMYRWFREQYHSSRVARSLYEGKRPKDTREREKFVKEEILYNLMYHVTYILVQFEKLNGGQLNDQFYKGMRGRKTFVGILTQLRVCHTNYFSYSLNEYGNLNFEIVSNSLDSLKLFRKGEIYNEIINNPALAKEKFDVSIIQLGQVAETIGIPMIPISEELKFENSLGIIGEVLVYTDNLTKKTILLSFLENHNDVKRAAFSTTFNLRLKGDTPISKDTYCSDDYFSGNITSSLKSSTIVGTPTYEIEDTKQVVIGDSIAQNVGSKYPVPNTEQLGPFEIFYFFGLDYHNATIPYSFAGDGSDLDSDLSNPKVNPNPPTSSGGLVENAKRQFGEFANDLKDYGQTMVRELILPSMLMNAAGLIPGGTVARTVAQNAVRSTRAVRNLRVGSNVSSHPL